MFSGRGRPRRRCVDEKHIGKVAAVSGSSGGAVVVLAEASNFRLAHQIRAFSNLQPVFFAGVLVDVDFAGVEAVAAVLLAAGDPVPLAGGDVVVIGLVIAFERAELLLGVVEGVAGFGVGHAADARGAGEAVAFVFDVHDARGVGHGAVRPVAGTAAEPLRLVIRTSWEVLTSKEWAVTRIPAERDVAVRNERV